MLNNKEIIAQRIDTIQIIENLCGQEETEENSESLLLTNTGIGAQIVRSPDAVRSKIISQFREYLDYLVDSQLYYDSLSAECKPFNDLNQKYSWLDIDFYQNAKEYYILRKDRDATSPHDIPKNYWALRRFLSEKYLEANSEVVFAYIHYFYRNNLPLSNHKKSIEFFVQSLITKKLLPDNFLSIYLREPQPDQKTIQQPQQPSYLNRLLAKKTLIGLASIFILAETAFGLTELLHSAKGPFAGVETLHKFFSDNHSFSISLGVVCLMTTLLILAYSAHHLIAQCCEANSEENVREQNHHA